MKINGEELLLSLGKVALHEYRAVVSNDSIAIKVIQVESYKIVCAISQLIFVKVSVNWFFKISLN